MDNVKFNLGDVVYLIIDPDMQGMVTGVLFRPHGIVYYVSWGISDEEPHYDIELTREKRFMNSAI